MSHLWCHFLSLFLSQCRCCRKWQRFILNFFFYLYILLFKLQNKSNKIYSIRVGTHQYCLERLFCQCRWNRKSPVSLCILQYNWWMFIYLRRWKMDTVNFCRQKWSRWPRRAKRNWWYKRNRWLERNKRQKCPGSYSLCIKWGNTAWGRTFNL